MEMRFEPSSLPFLALYLCPTIYQAFLCLLCLHFTTPRNSWVVGGRGSKPSNRLIRGPRQFYFALFSSFLFYTSLYPAAPASFYRRKEEDRKGKDRRAGDRKDFCEGIVCQSGNGSTTYWPTVGWRMPVLCRTCRVVFHLHGTLGLWDRRVEMATEHIAYCCSSPLMQHASGIRRTSCK